MHPLDGPRAKVERAKTQVVTLQTIAKRFFEQNTYTVVLAEFDRKTGGQSMDKRHGLRLLKSIHKKYWVPIESFQPYKRGNRGRHSPLFLLQQLNNTDKHRLITVVNPTFARFGFSGLAGGGSKLYKRVTLHPNAKVGYIMPLSFPVPTLDITPNGKVRGIKYETEIKVNFDFSPGIRFGDGCDAVERLPVIGVLQRIINEVSRIIESFASDF
jgi:hypothetical protein